MDLRMRTRMKMRMVVERGGAWLGFDHVARCEGESLGNCIEFSAGFRPSGCTLSKGRR